MLLCPPHAGSTSAPLCLSSKGARFSLLPRARKICFLDAGEALRVSLRGQWHAHGILRWLGICKLQCLLFATHRTLLAESCTPGELGRAILMPPVPRALQNSPREADSFANFQTVFNTAHSILFSRLYLEDSPTEFNLTKFSAVLTETLKASRFPTGVLSSSDFMGNWPPW